MKIEEKDTEIRLLKEEISRLKNLNNKLLLSHDWINFDGIIIRASNIDSIIFQEPDIEHEIKYPLAIINYWQGNELKSEILEILNEEIFDNFKKEINESLNTINYEFEPITRTIWQKNVIIAPDEQGEQVLKSKIVAVEKVNTNENRFKV